MFLSWLSKKPSACSVAEAGSASGVVSGGHFAITDDADAQPPLAITGLDSGVPNTMLQPESEAAADGDSEMSSLQAEQERHRSQARAFIDCNDVLGVFMSLRILVDPFRVYLLHALSLHSDKSDLERDAVYAAVLSSGADAGGNDNRVVTVVELAKQILDFEFAG